MNKTLWAKGEALDSFVLNFTVSDADLICDREILRFDVAASAAHARMLGEVGLLAPGDVQTLLGGLREVLSRADAGRFEITREAEDCHTAIELFLTERFGEVGKKIHLGRSRNDQVLVAMRLYLRDLVLTVLDELAATGKVFAGRFDEIGGVMWPGHTHFQPAMPMSAGMWLHAFLEHLLECFREGFWLFDALGANPLGAAAGFGTPLPLDRARTAELLGFPRVQRSPIEAQNSRGRYERRTVSWLSEIGALAEKLAFDLILYSSTEYGFVSIPKEFTTGSSIMPQKHNPDLLELTRARASILRSCAFELDALTAKLPSHYHRDFQYTKEPVVRAQGALMPVFTVVREVVGGLRVNEEKARSALTPELFATYAVYREVRQGATFRDAYRAIAATLKDGTFEVGPLAEDFAVIQKRTQQDFRLACEELDELGNSASEARTRFDAILKSVLEG